MQTTHSAPPDACNSTLTATLVQDLDFGDYVGTNGGIITIDTLGVRTAPGVILAGGTPSAATYALSNSGNTCDVKWVYITLIPSSMSINGPASMTVTNFVTSETGNKLKLAGGSATVTIGADLITNNMQAPGTYSGSFDVDFSY